MRKPYFPCWYLFFCISIFCFAGKGFAGIDSGYTAKADRLLQRVSSTLEKKNLSEEEFHNSVSDVNEAIYISGRTGNFLEKGTAYLNKAKLFATRPVNDSVQIFADSALLIFRRFHFSSQEADAAFEYIAYVKYRNVSIPRCKRLCDSAIIILNHIAPKSVKLADILYHKALIQMMESDFRNAALCCNQALSIYTVKSYPYVQKVYWLLGIVHEQGRLDTEGITYFFKSLRLADRYHDSATVFSNCTSISYYYSTMNQPKEAIVYLEKARSLINYSKNNNQALYIAYYLADAYNTDHQYDKALSLLNEGISKGSHSDDQYEQLFIQLLQTYVCLKNYRAAEKIYPKVFKLTKGAPQKWYFVSLANLASAEYFLATNQSRKARQHVDAVYASRQAIGYAKIMIKLEHLAYLVDSSQHKFASAIKHLQKYQQILDSTNTNTHNLQVTQLKVQYETEKKDRDILQQKVNIQTLERQSQLQKGIMQSQVLTRNLSFAAVGLLILTLILGYNRYQIKRKSNRELQAQQTRIEQHNESLKVLLAEREWLLKEAHHRTKNNLQIVISLLNSQLQNVENIVAKDILKESQLRMHSISLIHQKLYQSENLAGIDMRAYIYDLVNHLKDSFDLANRIKISLNLECLVLDVAQAVKIGLILNEAITNALKYAFPHSRLTGQIEIGMRQTDHTEIELFVADDGIGLKDEFIPEKSKSLGMVLMMGLCRQIRGRIRFINNNGLRVELLLSEKKPANTKLPVWANI